MLYLDCSESARNLKGNAQKVLKQFVRIIKHVGDGAWNQISSMHSAENTG